MKQTTFIILGLCLLLLFSIWYCRCPLIEEQYRERDRDGLYRSPYLGPFHRRGFYPYSTIPVYRRPWYYRLYGTPYSPMFIDELEADVEMRYCRRNPDCYPCPGWQFMGPPACP
jgi:hypothetical protein